MSAPVSQLRGLLLVARAQLALLMAVWLGCVGAFAMVAGGVDPHFTSLALGPYLGAVVGSQLAVVPAYLAVALVAAVLVTPWLAVARVPGRGALRMAAAVFLADLVLLVLSLGPALRARPGLLDSVARKVPGSDVYALLRWHFLEVASVGFWLAVVVAAAWYARALWRSSWRGARPVLALLVVLVPVGALALRPGAPPHATRHGGRPNVLVLATDSLRSDRLGVHGATRAGLTPRIDAFAAEAVDVRNLNVATASTLESWTTILTGQFPPAHGLRSMYPSKAEVARVEADADALPRLLAREGYDTFVASDWVGNCFSLVDFGFTHQYAAPVQSFRALVLEATVRGHPLVPLFFTHGPLAALVPGLDSVAVSEQPGALVERLFEDVDDAVARQRPFFGVLFVSPTHLPYNASYPYNLKYVDPAYDGPHRFQVEVRAHELITTGFAPTLPPATVQHLRDLYDGAVNEFDATVGLALDQLRARGLDDDTIVVVTTDHGEDLYDPGSTLGHGTNFFGGDQSTRVPFLVRAPHGRVRAGTAVDAVVRNADVAPTLLELLGLPAPASMEGESFAGLLRGEPEAGVRPAFAETCYLFFPKAQAMTSLSPAERAQVVELSGAADTLAPDPSFHDYLVLKPGLAQAVIDAKDRMVRTGRWKLIEIPGKSTPIRRLYDVGADPHQTRDLAGQGLEAEVVLSSVLHRYWAEGGRGLRLAAEPTDARVGGAGAVAPRAAPAP